MVGITTTRNGILVNQGLTFNPEDAKLFKPKKTYPNGDLLTEATYQNMYGVCESLLELFIRPMGMKLEKDPNLDYGYLKMDVVKKFTDGTLPYKRNKNNLTRGWCLLVASVIHRFFYSNYDLYKVRCPLDKSGKTFHWWLESKCRGHIIDLTEEQYIKRGITDIRKDGKKSSVCGMGSYSKKSRNMAYVIVNHLAPDAVQFNSIPVTGYISKHPEIIKTLQSKPNDMAFDEKKHAVIKEIKFHWDWCLNMNFNNENIFSEIKKYWEGSFIAFDPNKGLEIPKKFIENKSNKILKKDNLFFIEKLVLKSTQTNKMMIDEYFTQTLEFNNEVKELDQRVVVYNYNHKKGSHLTDHNKMGSLYSDMNEIMEEILTLQEKFINANMAFNKMFEEMQIKNLKNPADLTKSLYKKKSKFADFKFPVKEDKLPRPPWEGKGIIDPETGQSHGDIEMWEKEQFNARKEINDAYDRIHSEGHSEEVDWKKHFEDYRGKGFMNGIVPFLREPEEQED